MECTQRLECTQELYASQSERLFPEQIGFLGICGTKYPVKKGPNKIGRDPQTCDIVLNLNSISRQHAVINVLSDKDFMLMDLDSANKTKLSGKTLQAYIPHPIKNGDMVQFGQVFGVFRLLEEENDLPMTQALDIPETPVAHRYASKIQHPPSTTIPESPDVSDKDDSFIKPSQPNHFKSPKNKFIKPSGKTITIQPMGTNKIDNVFWNSSKKSKSLNLDFDDSSESLDDSTLSVKTDNTLTNKNNNDNIHEMETQVPFPKNQGKCKDSILKITDHNECDDIHEMETQVPLPKNQDKCYSYTKVANKNNNIHEMETQVPFSKKDNEITNSIYTAETQVPTEDNASPSIHSLETQLPDVGKIDKQIEEQDSQLDYYSTNKENDQSFYNAETQVPIEVLKKNNLDLDTDLFDAETQFPGTVESKKCVPSPNIYDAATQIPHFSPEATPNASEEGGALLKSPVVTAEKKDTIMKVDVNLKDIVNKSDEVIVFDEVDSQCFDENFESQTLLPMDTPMREIKENSVKQDNATIQANMPAKRKVRIASDSSSDCDDFIVPTQKLAKKVRDEDLTDCEEESEKPEPKVAKHEDAVNSHNCIDEDDFEILPTQKLPAKLRGEDLTDCEEESKETESNVRKQADDVNAQNCIDEDDIEFLPTQKLPEKHIINEDLKENEENFEDMPTQVLKEVTCKTTAKNVLITSDVNENPGLEDMLTQVLVEEIPKKDVDFEDLPTQVLNEDVENAAASLKSSSEQAFSEEIINPFKIPLQTPLKGKKKDTLKRIDSMNNQKQVYEEDEKYYAATQDILEDLCTQREISQEVVQIVDKRKNRNDNAYHISNLDDEVVLIADGMKQTRDSIISVDSLDCDYNVSFVKSLSSKQIREVVGVATSDSDSKPATLKRMSSDPSDVESTPKKVRPFKLMETDLPNSQEIKTSVSRKSLYTDSSSGSEPENEVNEENTPILYKPKKRNHKKDAKMNLTKAFEAKALPSRIITRVRKPTAKIQESDEVTKKNNEKILKPKFLTEQEDNIDAEILTENITRLRNKNEKKNKNDSSKLDEVKKENTSKTSESKSKKPEKVKSETKTSSKLDDFGKKENTSKTSDNKLQKTDNVKSETKIENKQQEKLKLEDNEANDKSLPIKTRHRCKTSQSSEKTKKKNSNTLDDTTMSKVNEVILSTSNEILDNAEKTNRSRRHRSRNENNNKSEKKSDTFKKESKRRKIKVNVELNVEQDSSPEKAVRRSTRNNATKRKNEDTQKKSTTVKPKSILKTSKLEDIIESIKSKNEDTAKKSTTVKPKSILKTSKPGENQSAVYSISSESGADSPKSLKRSAVADLDVPSPKRTRSSNCSSLRSTPARGVQTQFVLFTAFPSEEVKFKLESLGAIVVTDVKDCTVVLTIQIKRTFKLLCAVGLGKPIVGPSWVQACVDNNVIVDPWLYLIKDEASEQRFQFSLERTLSGKRNFLKGYNVSCTPSVMPNEAEMKLIVECSGGTWKAQKPQWVCVSCLADKKLWDGLKQQGATIVSSEFILSGVLRQRADVKKNRIDGQ